MRDNLGAVGWALTPEQIAALDAASDVLPPYPHTPYRQQEGFARLNPAAGLTEDDTMKLNPGLLALAVGAFGIGVTEFAPMGLLPVIADDLGVSIPTAGLLISAYALGVVIGAPLMTLTTGRVPRRTLLIAAGRHLHPRQRAGGAVGRLWHAAGRAGRDLVQPRRVLRRRLDRRGQPRAAGTTRGRGRGDVHGADDRQRRRRAARHLGGRASRLARRRSGASPALGVATMAALRLTLPAAARARRQSDAMAELRVLTRGPVLGALALTVVGSSAMFTVFTYIAPILRDVTHASLGFVTAMLVTLRRRADRSATGSAGASPTARSTGR